MKIKAISILLSFAAFGVHFASAQTGSMIGFEGEYFHSQSSDFKGDSNNNALGIDGVMTSLSYTWLYNESSMLNVGFSAGHTKYNFEADNPWRHSGDLTDDEIVQNLDLMIMHEHGISDKWSLLEIGFVGSRYSSEAKIGDGVAFGLGLGGRYKRSDTFSILLGVMYVSRLEDDALIIPMVGFDWQITERLHLDGMMGLGLSYDLFGDGKSELAVGLDFVLNDFVLEKDPIDGAQAAISPDGFGLHLSYTYSLSEHMSFMVKVSSYGEQEYEMLKDGDKVSSFTTEPTLFYGAGFNMSF